MPAITRTTISIRGIWITNEPGEKEADEFIKMTNWADCYKGLPKGSDSVDGPTLQTMGYVGIYRGSDLRKIELKETTL